MENLPRNFLNSGAGVRQGVRKRGVRLELPVFPGWHRACAGARHGACKGLASLATTPYPGNHETGERVRKNAMRLAGDSRERLR